MAHRLLMSPPKYFREDSDARRQWERLVELLCIAADVQIELIDPAPKAPDLVFTARAALISGELAIVSSFRDPDRRREQSLYRGTLSRLGFATTFLQQTSFEGGADALFDRVRPLMYVGYGVHSERAATFQLADLVAARIVPLQLVDRRFQHLDAALCPLGSGHAVAYMGAFSERSQRALRRLIEPGYLIEISSTDALNLACNAVEVDDVLVVHAVSAGLRDCLLGAGYRVFATDLAAFAGAGAGAKRLALRLCDGPPASIVAA